MIDLPNAFFPVPLDEASRQLTTISTPYGLFEYSFLQFGLLAAPAIFQKVVDEIIDGLPGVLAYQDVLIKVLLTYLLPNPFRGIRDTLGDE